MTMSVKANIHIEQLEPYRVTPQEPWQDKNRHEVHKLDWNEANIAPPFVNSLARKLLLQSEFFVWYPDCNAHDLHDCIASNLGIPEFQVLSFPGSDSALDSLCRVFIAPGEAIVTVQPSYANFNVFALSCGARLVKHDLPKPYIFDSSAVIDTCINESAKILYLVSPNNPCGYTIPLEDLDYICKSLPQTLVICDQAYVEFSPQADACHLVSKFENLVITRTFSKAYALAGMRIGYLIASHSILKNVSKIRNGKNINMLSQQLAIECLRQTESLRAWVDQVSMGKQLIYSAFQQSATPFYPSAGNFILFEPNDPINMLSTLKQNKIFIRDQIATTGGGLRVTVGDLSSTEEFLRLYQRIVKKNVSKGFRQGSHI